MLLTRHKCLICYMVPGAGVEPAYHIVVRDFRGDFGDFWKNLTKFDLDGHNLGTVFIPSFTLDFFGDDAILGPRQIE